MLQRNFIPRLLFALPVLPGLATATLASDADRSRLERYGRHLAQECSGCHRLDGVDNGIPSIIGWDAERFVITLKFYQNGQRTNPAMASVAKSLDEEQLAALAAFYASLAKK